MLDMIEGPLRDNGFSFCRIDGGKSLRHRVGALETFARDPNCTVLLASISAVGEGYVLGWLPLGSHDRPSTHMGQGRSYGGKLCSPHGTTLESHGRGSSTRPGAQDGPEKRRGHNPLPC